MTNKPNFTGVCPPQFLSTGSSELSAPQSSPAIISKRELIDIWFIEPLRNMNGHQAFVCLSVCLFLYEKYLKKTGQIGFDEKFCKGHKVFKQIGKDLVISAEDAFEFWTCWRNGLAHHGMPKNSDHYRWGMTGEQKQMVMIMGANFTINPWLIRDKILNKVENKKDIWDDEFAPLMKAFHLAEP